jgi:hypothetical protein
MDEEEQFATVDDLTEDKVTGQFGTHVIPGRGKVKFRKLSRFEVLKAGEITDPLRAEQFTLSRALVAPQMTEAQVAAWQRGSGAFEINDLSHAINELSGLRKGADKSGVSEVREQE